MHQGDGISDEKLLHNLASPVYRIEYLECFSDAAIFPQAFKPNFFELCKSWLEMAMGTCVLEISHCTFLTSSNTNRGSMYIENCIRGSHGSSSHKTSRSLKDLLHYIEEGITKGCNLKSACISNVTLWCSPSPKHHQNHLLFSGNFHHITSIS